MTALEWTHAVRDVPADGLAVERRATEAERERLARELAIPSVDDLTVSYRLSPRTGGRLALEGRLAATVTQECVVTLEPVGGTLTVPLDVVFSPDPIAPGAEIEGSLEDLDKPDEEPIVHGAIDVGRIVEEEILASLDPYPRRADASFEWTDEKGEAAGEHPFAVLGKLKKSPGPE